MNEFCQWLQATQASTWLRESIWGYPILAAVHVLGVAWFGGAVLKDHSMGKRAGLGFMIATGAILFYMSPVHCWESSAFRLKMLFLLVAVIQTVALPRAKTLSLACWAAMIFAGRGIAFF